MKQNDDSTIPQSEIITLDVKDRKILKELDQNPKIPTTTLAKKVRLSQQVVDYRLKRLMERKIISGFGAVYNFAKINYSQYRVLLTFGRVEENKKTEVITYLKNHNNSYWVALIGSKWDLLAVVFVKNYDAFEKFMDELFEKFPGTLNDYDALYVPYHEFFRHKFLDEKNTDAININFSAKETIPLDHLDMSILKDLGNNCRTSSLEIGNKHGVSYKTVQNRIRSLEEKRFISGYRMFLKGELLGYNAYIILFNFTSYGRNAEKKLFSYSKTNQYITQATKLFGRWSLMFHVRATSRRQLQDLLIEMRNLHPSLGQPEVIPIFEDIGINHIPIEKEKV